MAKETTFKEGDLVRWKHGDGPVMHVQKVRSKTINCEWFTKDHEFRDRLFPPDSLIQVPPEPSPSP